MAPTPEKPSPETAQNRITEEYRVLHKVAQILQTHGDLMEMLQNVMNALTSFEELKVENKAGIFLADHENQKLRLFTVMGDFSRDFIDQEQSVPFGECLCGRVALSGNLLMSASCFEDPRHERTYEDMTSHGHYIIPLKSGNDLLGVMFLYTNTHPAWYQHSQEVMLSIGGLIGEAIRRNQLDRQMDQYRDHLETMVELRTSDLRKANRNLEQEIWDHEKTQLQLRNLSNQIQEIREEEKSRISREVHDELGQAMTAMKMELENLQNKFTRKNPDFFNRMESLVGLADKTLGSIQRIAMELRPPILDAFGINEAIAWQAEEFGKRFDIAIQLDCNAEDSILSPELKTTLFRVVQECLTNIARHAEATGVKITLKQDPGFLDLVVEDNGKGLKEGKPEESTSLGLIGIRERVRYWKGTVVFKGAPEIGTVVHVRIPFPPPEAELS